MIIIVIISVHQFPILVVLQSITFTKINESYIHPSWVFIHNHPLFFLKLLKITIKFLEFLGTKMQDPANSYQEIHEYPRFLSRLPRDFTLGC